ncbi:hypothetical protein HRbin06_01008 [archaeon HR06]|nr:hypothetical protein HRbin06_01008 [archaeon HR06]
MSFEVVKLAMDKGFEYARKEINKDRLVLNIIAEKKPKDLLPGFLDDKSNIYLAEYREAWDNTFKKSLDMSSGEELKFVKIKLDDEVIENLKKVIHKVSNLSLFYQERSEASYLKIFNLANNEETLEVLKKVDEVLIKSLMDKASKRVLF